MRMYSSSGRSRWPWVIGAVLVVAVVVGGVAFAMTHQLQPPRSTTTPIASPTPSPTGGSSGAGDTDNAAPPTGCLGGLDRNAAMVLTAQKAAGHNAYGAVELATAFYRFIWQNPHPATSDLDAVSRGVMSQSASPQWKDLSAQYAAAGSDITKGVVPAGSNFHVSSTNGLWVVDPDSSSNTVTVYLAVGYVIDGALSPTKVAGIGLVMTWEHNAWHVKSGVDVDQKTLANGGIRYTGGC